MNEESANIRALFIGQEFLTIIIEKRFAGETTKFKNSQTYFEINTMHMSVDQRLANGSFLTIFIMNKNLIFEAPKIVRSCDILHLNNKNLCMSNIICA